VGKLRERGVVSRLPAYHFAAALIRIALSLIGHNQRSVFFPSHKFVARAAKTSTRAFQHFESCDSGVITQPPDLPYLVLPPPFNFLPFHHPPPHPTTHYLINHQHSTHPTHITTPLQWPAPSRQPVSDTITLITVVAISRWCCRHFGFSLARLQDFTTFTTSYQPHFIMLIPYHRQVHRWQGPA
jgi:hypothetical protein